MFASIPSFGLGTFRLQGQTVIDSVATGLEVGYRHIDTAQIYGNEAEVGQAIAASGVDGEAHLVGVQHGDPVFSLVDSQPIGACVGDPEAGAGDIGHIDSINCGITHVHASAGCSADRKTGAGLVDLHASAACGIAHIQPIGAGGVDAKAVAIGIFDFHTAVECILHTNSRVRITHVQTNHSRILDCESVVGANRVETRVATRSAHACIRC